MVTEGKEVKEIWQQYTEELYRRDQGWGRLQKPDYDYDYDYSAEQNFLQLLLSLVWYNKKNLGSKSYLVINTRVV